MIQSETNTTEHSTSIIKNSKQIPVAHKTIQLTYTVVRMSRLNHFTIKTFKHLVQNIINILKPYHTLIFIIFSDFCASSIYAASLSSFTHDGVKTKREELN